MASVDNKDIAHRFIQAWNAGGSAIVDRLASSDLVVYYSHFPEPVKGTAAFKEILAQTYHHFPDIAIEVEGIVVEGDRAVVNWTYRATHQQGEVFGVSASGRKVRVSGITRFRIENGKVIKEEGIVDNFSLMLQLGAVPVPTKKSE